MEERRKVEEGTNRAITLPLEEREEKGQFVKLKEIGPRVSMHLMKIEEMVNGGKVLYHRYITRTKQEEWAAEEGKLEKERQRQRHILRQQIAEKKKAAESTEKEEALKKQKSDKRLDRIIGGLEEERFSGGRGRGNGGSRGRGSRGRRSRGRGRGSGGRGRGRGRGRSRGRH